MSIVNSAEMNIGVHVSFQIPFVVWFGFSQRDISSFIYDLGFLGSTEVKNLSANAGSAGDTYLIPGLGPSPGGGNGSPLHCSYLKNPMDSGACQATVHGITKNWAQLSDGEERIYYYDLAFINSWVHFTSANVLKFQSWVNPGVSRKNWQGLWDLCFLKRFCPWVKRKMAPKSMWLVFLMSCVASTQVLDGEYQSLSWNWAHSQCSLYGLTVVKPSSIKCRLK